MPSKKKFNKYPPAYQMLFRSAMDKDITVPCATPTSAKTLRSDLYNFRQALRDVPDKSDPLLQLETICDTIQISRRGSDIVLHQPMQEKFAAIITKAISHE